MHEVSTSGARLEPVLREQRRLNATTRDATTLFASHRSRLTFHVLDAAFRASARSILVLGAGNGNDLDLGGLLRAVDTIHLVDLDADALAHARERVGPSERGRVVCHGGLDVTGALALLGQYATKRLSLADFVALATICLEEPLTRLPRADVVVSPCLLSPIMASARMQLGPEHPDLEAVARALLLGHLRLLVRLLRAGGAGVLASDVADSDAVPLDDLLGTFGPLETLRTIVDIGRAYTGTDPSTAADILTRDEDVAPLLNDVRLEQPWRWQLSPTRSYLVYGLRFSRT